MKVLDSDLIDQLPLTVVPADRGLTLKAAELKSRHALAYADCFAAALAMDRGVDVVTGDREFKKLEPETTVKWL